MQKQASFCLSPLWFWELCLGWQFFRVQVGIQSPDGISALRGILRRFSDFLKLFTAVSICYTLSFSNGFSFCFTVSSVLERDWLTKIFSSSIFVSCIGGFTLQDPETKPVLCVLQLKQSFPKKKLPAAPAKHSLMRMNSSTLLLEVW